MSVVSLRNILRVQNGLSFMVFLVFPLAQASAFLLWCAPRSETLWFVSVKLNRLTDPVTAAFNSTFHSNLFPAWAWIGSFCLILIWATSSRNRLVGAALLHAALGICVISSADLFQQLILRHQSAHLGIIFDSSSIGWSIGTTLLAAAVLMVFCIINHVVYLFGVKQEVREQGARRGTKTVRGYEIPDHGSLMSAVKRGLAVPQLESAVLRK